MKLDDRSDSPLPSLRHRHGNLQKSLAAIAVRRFLRPTACLILIFAAYVLGYASHSQPPATGSQSPPSNSQPLASLSESQVSQPTDDLLAHNDFSNPQCSSAVSTSAVRRTILDRVFDSTDPWEGFPPPHAAAYLQGEWTKGWGSNASVFEHLINQVQPETIIEVGTFLGASAVHMASLTRKLGLKTQIICIDDFRSWPGWYDEEKSLKMVNGDTLLLYQFMQNVAAAKATGEILFLPFSTSTALSGLCDWGVYGDLVEIDAAHDFHSAWVDINNAYKILRPGGVLFGHDIVWEGVKRAVHLFAKIHGFRVRIDGEHWILY